MICHDGTVDLAAAKLATEELWFPKWEFGGWPWEAGTVYEQWNPIRFADKFQTPTLVITNEKDFRVPFEQGLELFTALQLKGVASKLLVFPDEGHWVLKPGNALLWHNVMVDWLHGYLGGAEADAKVLERIYSVTK
jgi:dipeptidyl aminopeptidase/acylaminoacyl peptidase